MSDLIDRQALRAAHGLGADCHDCKREMKSCQYDRDYSLMDFCEWLDDAPTASPWHRVEDGLPEEDVEVLISYRYKEGEGDTSHVDIDITSYGQMYFGGREVAGVKHWRPPFEYFSSNYEVIAWMPLPEPPKEDA